jgi:hypothetical protein
MHRKRAGFGALLPLSWRTTDQSSMQSSYGRRNAQKALEQAKERLRGQKVARVCKKTAKKPKNAKAIKTFADPKKMFLSVP